MDIPYGRDFKISFKRGLSRIYSHDDIHNYRRCESFGIQDLNLAANLLQERGYQTIAGNIGVRGDGHAHQLMDVHEIEDHS